MKTLKFIFIFSTITGVFAGCKNDVASALLKGEPVEYEFTNAQLEEQFVEEGLVQQFSLTSNNGGNEAKIEALYIGSQDAIKTDTVILYLHGNLSSMNPYWEHAANLANVGGQHRFGVMMFDYRGFGNSEGASEDITDLVADAEACIKWLTERGLTYDRLVVVGFSLGAMPAAHLANNPTAIKCIHKLSIEAPQTTSTKLLQDATGLSLDGSTVTAFHYDIPKALADYKQDFLWIHGTEDQTASFENFKKVYDDFENPNKSSAELEGLGHDISIEMGFETYETLMLDFIKK